MFALFPDLFVWTTAAPVPLRIADDFIVEGQRGRFVAKGEERGRFEVGGQRGRFVVSED